ncbi:MAG: cytochrome C oxidase subunit IV family protein [Planctomycetota bacterium]|jgi:cytochrome c oxidase subunit 4
MDTDTHETEHHVPYRAYVNVWLTLVMLTVVTVAAAYTDLGHLAVFAALLIATVKGSLVALYFMHLRYERPLFAYMIVAAFGTFAIFVALTFADYWAR